MVKSYDTDLSFCCWFLHGRNLAINSSLHTLDSRYVGLVLFTLKELVGAISKLSLETLHWGDAVTLNLMPSFDSFGYTHWSRDIKTEYYWNILVHFFGLLISDLSSSFNNIINRICLWDFLFIKEDFVFKVTEFTLPDLVSINLLYKLACIAKYCLTFFTNTRISSS